MHHGRTGDIITVNGVRQDRKLNNDRQEKILKYNGNQA